MNIGMGLIALSLLGGEPQAAKAPHATLSTISVSTGGRALPAHAAELPQTSYEVRIIQTSALHWRNTVYKHCERIDRQGVATLWTLDDKAVKELIVETQNDEGTNLISTPKVTAFDGSDATVSMITPIPFVSDIARMPVGKDGSVAFRPVVDKIDEGVTVKVSSVSTSSHRNLKLAIKSRWVCGTPLATTTEKVERSGGGTSSIAATMQLPQLVDAEISGSYGVPLDRQVLVSLGTATIVDRKNQPKVMERLAIITPRHILTEAEEAKIPMKPAKVQLLKELESHCAIDITASVAPNAPECVDIPLIVEAEEAVIWQAPAFIQILKNLEAQCGSGASIDSKLARTNFEMPQALPPALHAAPMPKPRVPSRSLPGHVALPPLPDEAVSATTLHTVPAPQASGQHMIVTAPAPAERLTQAQLLRRDPNVAQSAFEPAPEAVATATAVPTNAPTVSQMLRRDPNVKVAAQEPVPAAVSRLLPPPPVTPALSIAQPIRRDPNVAPTTFETPVEGPKAGKGFTIPFVGRVTIDIDVRIK